VQRFEGESGQFVFATAEPVDPATGDRFFAADERAIIFFSTKPIPNQIVESATVVRYAARREANLAMLPFPPSPGIQKWRG
jgi:hypothetical protein